MRKNIIGLIIISTILFGCSGNTTGDNQNSTKETENQEAVKVDDSTKEKQKVDIKEVERQILEKYNQQQYREGINIAREYKKDNVITKEDFNAISKYFKYKLNESNESYKVVDSLMSISDDYAGIFSNEIKDLKLKFKPEIDEILAEKAYLESAANYKPLYVSPSIGMTAEQVLKSIWGEPEDINKTTTASGVTEQWVYSGFRYIYLEDGIVTVIQE